MPAPIYTVMVREPLPKVDLEPGDIVTIEEGAAKQIRVQLKRGRPWSAQPLLVMCQWLTLALADKKVTAEPAENEDAVHWTLNRMFLAKVPGTSVPPSGSRPADPAPCPVSESPRPGSRARRWFRRRIAAWFYDVGHQKHGIEPEIIDPLIEWFAERAEEYLRWIPEDNFRGRHYSTGYWSVDFGAMSKATQSAGAEIEAERRRQNWATLGDISEATVGAALARLEGTAPLPAEPDGQTFYPDRHGPAVMQFYDNRNRIQDLGLRACRKCGESFKPKVRKRQTCDVCLEAARAKRGEAARKATD